MYSFKIEQAIKAASVLHQEQKRRGPAPYPYISHLIAVAMLVSDYTDNEDVVVAAFLHDTIEDTDYTPKALLSDFGEAVHDIVLPLSETKEVDGEPLSWQERKAGYLKQLKQASEETLLVVAADKIHNMRSAIEGYYNSPHKFLTEFGGTLEERLTGYQKISNLLNRRLENDIVHEFNHVFTEYKNFIEYVKTETGV